MNIQEIKNHINTIITNSEDTITSDEIYSTLQTQINPGRTQETIRKYIREMVNSGEYLIGSSNSGFYKISTQELAIKAINYLENRIPDLQNRATTIRNTWNASNPENQI